MRSTLIAGLAAYVAILPFTGPQRSLADDGRIATVTDHQGSSQLRPVGRDRWTPLGPQLRIVPGDQVRTSKRGANAVELALEGGGRLVVGPGSLVELEARDKLRLYRGDIELRAQAGHAIAVRGPGGFEARVAKTIMLRAGDKRTERLAAEPRWLTGYRASTTDEWSGSLVAKVDGRDVALHVGYHKVGVEIRDQIARTTIEQSFVNSTGSTLEGVFYFPLPPGASISGFGMWIGQELVEADIVEKQRARAIYEDILRRRKDPGLLEWSGGNLFKARVFPIFPHSEKRIRVRYTQVLPLEGGKLHYRYALRSELLRSHPLRELRIGATISSAMPIESVTSPTHEIQVRRTAHAASARHDDEGVTPDKDFELVIGLDRAAPVTLIPHRRDGDGYFMLLLTPPLETQNGLERSLAPEGKPLDVVIVADTSASMDRAARQAQATFIGDLLGLLGSKDRFRLMTSDVFVRWFEPEPVPPDAAHTDAALAFLAERESLGWTDLDAAFDALVPAVTADTVVVWVGDGVQTTGNADPVALAQRFAMRGKTCRGTFHAVAASSKFEQGVLESIAGIGGGSVRMIGDDPSATALRLLREVALPKIKDLAIEFKGLRTARVYPARLPNLPAGRQQIVLGRFLPGRAAVREGEVVVTGSRGGERLRFTGRVRIDTKQAGNSFVPRLWARRHVDALLAEGRETRSEIVAFSEEFGIMTPYTSFLVLENDADRERYGVTRRVKMRDGERFFADGKDAARQALRRKQMQVAKSYRLDLRRRMLRELAGLGRNLIQPVALGLRESVGDEATSFSIRAKGKAGGANEEQQLGPPRPESDPTGRPAPDDTVRDAPKPSGPDLQKSREALELDRLIPDKRLRSRQDRIVARRPYRFSTLNLGSFRFPSLPAPPRKRKSTSPVKLSEAARTLLASLDRKSALAMLEGGIEMTERGSTLHPLRGYQTATRSAYGLFGKGSWFARTTESMQTPSEHWFDAKTRGAVTAGVWLGRRRPSVPADRWTYTFPLRDQGFGGLATTYAAYEDRVETDGDVARLVLRIPKRAYEVRFRIDRKRKVLLERSFVQQGKTSSRTVFGEFVEAAGLWWPTKVTTFDARGRRTAETRRTIRLLEPAAYEAAMRAARAPHARVIFVTDKDPSYAVAREAAARGKAGFVEHFVIALHWLARQKQDDIEAAWQAAAAKIEGRPGRAWLRLMLLAQTRRSSDILDQLRSLEGSLGDQAESLRSPLAKILIDYGQSRLAAPELLRLFDRLAPTESASYALRRAQWLRSAGRGDEALAVEREYLRTRPFDFVAVTTWIQRMQSQDPDAARRVIADSLAKFAWNDYETDNLWSQLTQIDWNVRELERLVADCARWTATHGTAEQAWLRWLSALALVARYGEADAWTRKTIAAGLPELTTPRDRAKLGAAIQFALGQGWNFYSGRADPRHFEGLAQLARALLERKQAEWSLLSRLIGNGHFQATDEFKKLRQAMRDEMLATDKIATMDLRRLEALVGWLPWGRNQVDAETQGRVVAAAMARYEATSQPNDRNRLAALVLRLLDSHGEATRAIAFLRKRVETASQPVRWVVAATLQSRLLARPWSADLEDEVFALMPELVPPQTEAVAREQQLARNARVLADALLRMRFRHLLGEPADYEKLPRAALARKRRSAWRAARIGLAAAFENARKTCPKLAVRWLDFERLSLRAELGDAPRRVDGEVRELFPASRKTWLDQVARERSAIILAYVATRSRTSEAQRAACVAFLRERVEKPLAGESIDWRYHLYRLLIALDETEALAATLQSWIVPAKADKRWLIALGYASAELGRLDEAVAAFETAARAKALEARDYAVLADWLLALGQTERHDAAVLAGYNTMNEWQLRQIVDRERGRLQRSGQGVPGDLDPAVLRVLRVLFAKANNPSQHVWQLQSLYEVCKDFRVLESIPHAVIGHTPQGIYAFLQQIGSVIAHVHEEATCDALRGVLLRARKRSSRQIDRRALTLLQAIVERRAAEVLNAPGPHTRKAIAALKASFRGDWLDGERSQMAQFLASLGRIKDPELARLQRDQLGALLEGEPRPDARYRIAWLLAVLEWNYGRHDTAIDMLGDAIAQRRGDATELPVVTRAGFQRLISWLESRHRWRVAERSLDKELDAGTGACRIWVRDIRFQFWQRALRRRVRLAAGAGAALYARAHREQLATLAETPRNRIQGDLQNLCSLYRIAHGVGVRRAAADLADFARSRLGGLVERLANNRYRLVSVVAQTLDELRGPNAALALAADWIEREPRWMARTGHGGWRMLGSSIGSWIRKSRGLGALEPRLLAIVTAALELDLTSLRAATRAVYTRGSLFWNVHLADFRRIAARVLELHADSPARVLYTARYLWDGLADRGAAIDALLAAQARGRLNEDGRWVAAAWLRQERRYSAALPLLDVLVGARPDRLDYRTTRIDTLYRAGHAAAARAEIAKTEHHFRTLGKWNEGTIYALASTARNCGVIDRAIAWYEELIPLHQRTHAGRGIGNGMLSAYQSQLADCYAKAGRFDDAVDSAAAAIVSWGANRSSRRAALHALEVVVARIEDLDGYVERYDARVAESGFDAPVIRKAIGRAWIAHRRFEPAVTQLERALGLQPSDAELYTDLVRCYDALGRFADSCAVLKRSLAENPHQPALFEDLARRYAKLGLTAEARRAATSLVEITPLEADGHRRFARWCESHKDIAQAVVQWRRVTSIRSDEPDGWLELARVQIASGAKAAARKTLEHVVATGWARRFGDVKVKAMRLMQSAALKQARHAPDKP